MSNSLAVATVTAVLREMLAEAISADPFALSAGVTTLSPGSKLSPPCINIYLYQVTHNAAARNLDAPTRRGSDGSLLRRPQVALDLHYLLSFIGDDSKLEPQRLCAIAARTLHDWPVIGGSYIDGVIKNLVAPLDAEAPPDTSLDFLKGSDLAAALDSVRLTPTAFSLEELSKLWQVFFQTDYYLSMAYVASFVMVDSGVTPPSPLPTRARGVYAVPLTQPVIEGVVAADGGSIVAASRIVIQGSRLAGNITTVLLDAVEQAPARGDVTPSSIRLDLPPSMGAGIHGVQVAQLIPLGQPPTPHRGFESNAFAFAIHPTITVNPTFSAGPTNTAPLGAPKVYDATIDVTLSPNVKVGQRVVLLLTPNSEQPVRGYVFTGPSPVADAATISFPVKGIAAATYFLRAQVGGVESVPVPADAPYWTLDFPA